jgi:hypothetical protein
MGAVGIRTASTRLIPIEDFVGQGKKANTRVAFFPCPLPTITSFAYTFPRSTFIEDRPCYYTYFAY